MESLLKDVEKFISGLDRFLVFSIATAVVLTVFLINLLLAFFRSGYSTKKRCSYLVLSAVVVLVENAFLLNRNSEYLVYTTLSFSLLLFIPLLLIRVKTGRKKQVELARYIDDKIKSANSVKEEEPIVLKCQPTMQKPSKMEINFTHVRNVIERLNYYALSPFDRKQVNDLNCLLTEAERVGITQELKEKINDGLGVLLKIMSKYGV